MLQEYETHYNYILDDEEEFKFFESDKLSYTSNAVSCEITNAENCSPAAMYTVHSGKVDFGNPSANIVDIICEKKNDAKEKRKAKLDNIINKIAQSKLDIKTEIDIHENKLEHINHEVKQEDANLLYVLENISADEVNKSHNYGKSNNPLKENQSDHAVQLSENDVSSTFSNSVTDNFKVKEEMLDNSEPEVYEYEEPPFDSDSDSEDTPVKINDESLYTNPQLPHGVKYSIKLESESLQHYENNLPCNAIHQQSEISSTREEVVEKGCDLKNDITVSSDPQSVAKENGGSIISGDFNVQEACAAAAATGISQSLTLHTAAEETKTKVTVKCEESELLAVNKDNTECTNNITNFHTVPEQNTLSLKVKKKLKTYLKSAEKGKKKKKLKCKVYTKSTKRSEKSSSTNSKNSHVKKEIVESVAMAINQQIKLEQQEEVAEVSKKVMKKKIVCTCDICGKHFSRRPELRRHLRIHSGERPFACEHCERTFAQKYHLRRHMRNVHHSELAKLFQCGLCKSRFDDNYLLERHMKSHGTALPFRCEICWKMFTTKRSMKEHIMTRHVGVKPFACPRCDKKFARKFHMERHMGIHTGDKPYTCEYCGRAFLTRGNMNAHTRRVHLKEKPYTCGVCNKNFFTKKCLQSHFKTHTGERPHQCEICEKRFSQRQNLISHLRIHSGDRPYKCEACAKCYTRISHLKRHMQDHKDNEIVTDEDTDSDSTE